MLLNAIVKINVNANNKLIHNFLLLTLYPLLLKKFRVDLLKRLFCEFIVIDGIIF